MDNDKRVQSAVRSTGVVRHYKHTTKAKVYYNGNKNIGKGQHHVKKGEACLDRHFGRPPGAAVDDRIAAFADSLHVFQLVVRDGPAGLHAHPALPVGCPKLPFLQEGGTNIGEEW